MYFTHFQHVNPFATDKGDLADAYQLHARLMDHWRAVLPPDRFIEIDYENLIAEREAVTRRLIAFAGLDWDDACLSPSATSGRSLPPAYGKRANRSTPPRSGAGAITSHGSANCAAYCRLTRLAGSS